MSQHKFKVGQAVDYLANHRGVPASLKAYTIIRLLPSDGTICSTASNPQARPSSE
jgi:hypothetical protein